MEARVRKDKALVYTNVGVYAGVEITLAVDSGAGATISFGLDGPDVIMDFADLDSLERLAVVAADGVRQLRAQITNTPAATTQGDTDPLVGAGVSG